MEKRTVSLCMIVKNEEKFIDQCLRSVKDQVDEIIIVDTGSTDRTVEIAKKHHANIYHFEWVDDFSAAKNFALEKATCEYVLFLDGDEYLEENADLQKDLATDNDLFWVCFRNFQGDNEVLYHKDYRLFNREKGFFYHGRLHEQLKINNTKIPIRIGEASFIINHIGYMPDVKEEKDKQRRNLRIMEKAVQDTPSGHNLYHYGNVLMGEARYEEALDVYIKAYKELGNSVIIKRLIFNIAQCLYALGRTEVSIGLLLDGIRSYPHFTDYYYQCGIYYLNNGYLKDAEAFFKKCIELGDVADFITLEGSGSYLATFRLSELYLKQNKYNEALEFAINTLQIKKDFPQALYIVLLTMLKLNISAVDTIKMIRQVYPLKNFEEIQALLSIMYKIRHPLLSFFLEKIDPSLRGPYYATAKLYNKDYEIAKAEWEKLDHVPSENIIDVILLALLLRDDTILSIIDKPEGIDWQDWTYIQKIVSQQHVTEELISPACEEIFIQLCDYVLRLREMDTLVILINVIRCGSENIKIRLAQLLSSYGYDDVALKFVENIRIEFESNPSLIELLLEIHDRKSENDKVKKLYKIIMNKNYNAPISILEKLYAIFEKNSEVTELLSIQNYIKQHYHLARWLEM